MLVWIQAELVGFHHNFLDLSIYILHAHGCPVELMFCPVALKKVKMSLFLSI